MIELTWPGGEHPFRLGLAELEAVQDKCDAGPELILSRIRLGHWRVTDLREVLRFGLIGAGMERERATKLVSDALERAPLMQFKVPALAVLAAALIGTADDPVGEPSPAGEITRPDETDAGGSALSTASEPGWGSAPSKSDA